MVTNKLKQLADYQNKVSALQAAIAKERAAELGGLYKKYGFDSPNAFIKAIRAAAGHRKGKAAGGKRRKRAVITPAMREKIRDAIKAGKTGPQVAKEFGISLPSVQNIKKEFGLVKARK